MNTKTSNEILKALKDIIKNPKPELNFSNNFELLIAVVLSAQTTDKRVNQVTEELFLKYPNPEKLSLACYEDVYSIILPLGLAKMKANNIISLSKELHENYNDIVPSDIKELMKLPGVGRKTANVVLALGFNIPAMPVDTHLFRMAKRLGYIKENMNIEDAEDAFKKYIKKEEWIDSHHLFLLFGRYYCKAVSPLCKECKLKQYCKYKG